MGTAEVLDPMTYSTAFRFYTDGGLAPRLIIGPLKRVNLGITFDAQRIIGAGDPHMAYDNFGGPTVIFDVRPNQATEFMARPAQGANMAFIAGTGVTPEPWLKLTRAGNTFTAYWSEDGSNWQFVGSTNVSIRDVSDRT